MQEYLGKQILTELNGVDFALLKELRVRVGRPIAARIRDAEKLYGYKPTETDIREIMENISGHSLYAFENELTQGYLTLPYGHRIGVCGQVVVENGEARGWRFITGLCIRVAHAVHGCADAVLPHLKEHGKLVHTMIISPPGFGKTTLLRDIVRQISNGGQNVGLADERGEVAGSYRGVPQLDIGNRTDTIDGCPKPQAMHMLLRAMAPEIIAVDELGGEADIRAVDAVLNAGITLLCTAHGSDVDDVRENPMLATLVNRGVFKRFVVLGPAGKVVGIF